MPLNTNPKIIKGMAWTALDRFSNQIVQFMVGIIIARLVTPTEYGVLGILMIMITISQVFIDSGLGGALIYNNNKDSKDLYTTFTFNLIISVVFFIILFLCAAPIEFFFNIDNLRAKMQVCSFILIINSLIVVPTAILKIDMNFRALAFSNIISTVSSGILAVILAYLGTGVWALIVQQLARSFILLFSIYYWCKWLPRIVFYKKSFYRLYKYGINLFFTSCITKFVDEATSLFIGKFLTPHHLGLFTRANQFSSLPGTVMGTTVSSVLFPSFSRLRNNDEEFTNVFKKSIQYQAAISIPLFLWLAMLSEPLIRVLLTEKWLEVVPIMQILCIGRCLTPIANISEQVLMSKGRSDLMLKQQILKMLIKFIAVVFLLKFGILAVACADAIYTTTQMAVTCFFLRGISSYGFFKQLWSIAIFMICGILSALMGYAVAISVANDCLKILVSLTTSIICYAIPITRMQHEVNFKLIWNKLIGK